MKLFILLALIGIVWGQSSPSTTETSDVPTTTAAPDDGTTTTGNVVTSGNTGSTEAPGSTASPGSTESPGPTQSAGPTSSEGPTQSAGPSQAPNTGSTSANTNPSTATTTLASTAAPTTTPPLKRDVSFNIDCSAGTQCSFQFKIAEPLMRFVNTTILESVLTNLTSKINDLNAASTSLSSEEGQYIQTLQDEINKLDGDVTSLSENVNGTLSDAQSLQDTATTAAETAQKYLAAALCFRNDINPSEYCGQLAFGS